MFGLLIIVLCSFLVGKIHGQETVVPYVINAQLTKKSPANRRPAAIQEISRQLASPPPAYVIEILVQPTEAGLFKPQLFHGSDSNLPQSTVTANRAQRTHIVSQNITQIMEGTNNSNVNSVNNNSTGDHSVINEMESNGNKPKVKLARPDSLPLPTGNMTITNTLKSTIAKDLPPMNVTLDERSSFNGDDCPTGYVKVNGKCIQPE